MIRRSFLKRMALAAAACAFIDVPWPKARGPVVVVTSISPLNAPFMSMASRENQTDDMVVVTEEWTHDDVAEMWVGVKKVGDQEVARVSSALLPFVAVDWTKDRLRPA